MPKLTLSVPHHLWEWLSAHAAGKDLKKFALDVLGEGLNIYQNGVNPRSFEMEKVTDEWLAAALFWWRKNRYKPHPGDPHPSPDFWVLANEADRRGWLVERPDDRRTIVNVPEGLELCRLPQPRERPEPPRPPRVSKTRRRSTASPDAAAS